MQEIKFYRTCNFGGSDRDMIDRYFETEKDAHENVMHDIFLEKIINKYYYVINIL